MYWQPCAAGVPQQVAAGLMCCCGVRHAVAECTVSQKQWKQESMYDAIACTRQLNNATFEQPTTSCGVPLLRIAAEFQWHAGTKRFATSNETIWCSRTRSSLARVWEVNCVCHDRVSMTLTTAQQELFLQQSKRGMHNVTTVVVWSPNSNLSCPLSTLSV